MRSRPRTPVLLSLLLVLSGSLAACGGMELFGLGPTNPNDGNQVAPDQPGQGGGGAGGGVDGNPGDGVDLPAPAPGGGGGGDPLDGMKPSIEEPVTGQVDPQPVSVAQITPSIDGRHVEVLLAWWGGPAPCSVLDSVVVDVDGRTITMTPREGADPDALNMACPAIAMLRGTIVDLGELEPGAWTLAVSGGILAPISITVE